MEPLLFRIVGVVFIVTAVFLATSKLAPPFKAWQIPFVLFLLGVAAYIRSFLIEQGYADKS
jgi:hypothetical protein